MEEEKGAASQRRLNPFPPGVVWNGVGYNGDRGCVVSPQLPETIHLRSYGVGIMCHVGAHFANHVPLFTKLCRLLLYFRPRARLTRQCRTSGETYHQNVCSQTGKRPAHVLVFY